MEENRWKLERRAVKKIGNGKRNVYPGDLSFYCSAVVTKVPAVRSLLRQQQRVPRTEDRILYSHGNEFKIMVYRQVDNVWK